MGFFGTGNDDGKPKAPPPAPTTPPVDKVLQMRAQGLSNNQIIQNLQNQGYDPNLVFDALNQADIKGGVEAVPVRSNDFNPDELQNPMQVPSDFSPPVGMEPAAPMPSTPPMGSNAALGGIPPMDTQLDSGSLERIEEIAEAIIDEKWNEIVKSINKIIDWKDRADAKMTKFEQSILDMKQDFDNLTKGVLGKVGEYDQNLVNIGSEIKAMEQVFQKVLPTLTENVHTLDKLTRDLKGKKKD